MKGPYVCLRFFILAALSVVVLIIAPVWAELTPEQLGQELKTAVQNNDLKKTPQLTAENPQTAYGLQPEFERSAAASFSRHEEGYSSSLRELESALLQGVYSLS